VASFLKLGSKQDEREEKSKDERRMIHGEQCTKQIKKNRPETTAAIATTHKLTKKDDAESTKTIVVTTNNQVRQDEETTDRPIKEMQEPEITSDEQERERKKEKKEKRVKQTNIR